MEERNYLTQTLSQEDVIKKVAELEDTQLMETRTRRMLNRNCWGWGVVYGLHVTSCKDGITIEKGLALDAEGREIYIPEDTVIQYIRIFANWQPDDGDWGLCLSYPSEEEVEKGWDAGFYLELKGTREEGDICIAILHTAWEGPRLLMEGVNSPVDSFHFAESLQTKNLPAPILPDETCAVGEFTIHLQQYPDCNGIYYSPEICHGLGKGRVQILLSVQGWQEGRRCILSGDIGLFQGNVSCAVKSFPDTGTFIAAVRCRETLSDSIKVEWFARRMEQ